MQGGNKFLKTGKLHLVRVEDGGIVQIRNYANAHRRADIIEAWRKLYGPAFDKRITVVDYPTPAKERSKKVTKKSGVDLGHVRRNPNTSGFKKRY